MRRKSDKLSQNERQLWRKETANDTPLSKENGAPPEVDTKAEAMNTRDIQPDFSEITPASGQRHITQQALVPNKLDHLEPGRIKQLIGKNSKRDASLDLHGLTQEQAYSSVCDFIEEAYASQKRQLRIITGKGSGTLKEQLVHWLNSPKLRPHILAISYASAREGGEGALIVLLRRT